MTYNCEILNQISEKKIKANATGEKKLEQLYLESPAEKVHLRLCRNILGVSNKTRWLAVLGKLGEYPVDIFAYTQIVQYWHGIAVKMKRNSLIYKVFNSVQEDYQNNHFNWMNTIRFLLNYCSLNQIWENPASISIKALGNKVKDCLPKYYVEYFDRKVEDPVSASLKIPNKPQNTTGNKLCTYSLIKPNYAMEPYLLCVTNREKRQCMSKLRCSNHSLAIEVGRHKKLQVNERLCSNCNEIEDEIYFISNCALFDTVRKKFLQEISEMDQTFSQLDDEESYDKQ